MKNDINKKNISITCLISWLIIFGSVNVYPVNVFQIKSFLEFINSARIILPLIFGVILFLILFQNLNLKNDIKKLNIYLILFFLLFTLEFIGVFLNNRLNFQTLYLLIFSFVALLIIATIEQFELQKIYKLLMFGSILYILIAVLILFYLKFDTFKIETFSGNFYSIFHPDIELLKQAPPRATGYSRMLAVISLFIIIYSNYFKKNVLKILLIIANTILAIIIWQFQSRGTFACYYSSILIFIFLIQIKNSWKIKISKLFLYIFIPILLSTIMTTQLSSIKKSEPLKPETNLSLKKNEKKMNSQDLIILKNQFTNNRLFQNKTTTGRFDLWSDSIKFFDKKKFFGYGVQGDRIVIHEVNKLQHSNSNPYGNNVSNGAVYSFLSGGYLAFIIFLMFYFVNLKLGINFLKQILSSKKLDPIVQYSVIIIFFFSVRSIFENSYAVFSIDFLLFLLAINITYNYLNNIKNNENFSNNSMFK